MAFTQLRQPIGAGGDPLRQALIAQLMSREAPANWADAITRVGAAVGAGLAGRNDDARQQQIAELLTGTPAATPSLPGAGPGDVTGFTPAQPGMLPELSQQQVQAMLLVPGGRQALLSRALERAVPEPISPFQQASLDVQREGLGLQQQRIDQSASQFGESIGLERRKLAADEAYRRAKLGLDAAELSASGNVKLSDVAGIRKEYTGASEDFVQTRDAYRRISTVYGKEASPAGDLALIFNYMKMLDPQSVVREAEAASVAASGSYGERLQAWGNQLLTGERLTPAMRSDVASQASSLMQSQLDSQLSIEKEFGDLAEEYGVPRHHVTPDLIGPLREGVPPIARTPEGEVAQAGKGIVEQGIGMAREAIGELTGEGAAAPTPTGPQSTEEGLTATNPQTGERVIYRNGRWEKL